MPVISGFVLIARAGHNIGVSVAEVAQVYTISVLDLACVRAGKVGIVICDNLSIE
jgi:hypothetical protein